MKRRIVLQAAPAALAAAAAPAAAHTAARGPSRTFVLVHGAWHGGWCWRPVADMLRAAGHRVHTPTQTGLGERAHLLSRQITLDTFVDDIANLLRFEQLDDVVLVGHSFGGIAVSGVADIAAGMYAYSNILAALMQRGRTGLGQRIDVSMLESMVEWMTYPLYYAYEGAAPPPRAGAAHATIYPYGPFPAGDGRTVMLGVQNEREWVLFCERVLLRPEIAADPRFTSNSRRVHARQALRRLIVEAFADATAEQVIERLDGAQIANARMNDMHEVWLHPQLKARGRWTQVGTAAGPVPALLPPGAPDAASVRMDPVPALGEHTDAILAELGVAPDEVGRAAPRRRHLTRALRMNHRGRTRSHARTAP